MRWRPLFHFIKYFIGGDCFPFGMRQNVTFLLAIIIFRGEHGVVLGSNRTANRNVRFLHFWNRWVRFFIGSVLRFSNAVSVCIGLESVLNRVKHMVRLFMFTGLFFNHHIHIKIYNCMPWFTNHAFMFLTLITWSFHFQLIIPLDYFICNP